MKLRTLILLLTLSFYFTQDRSTIFTTFTGEDPNPDNGGYDIKYTDDENIYGAANRFYINNEYALERVYIYLSYEFEDAFELQQVQVSICEDNNGVPGDCLTDNIINLSPSNFEGNWYMASLLETCAKINTESYYWIVVLPFEGTNAKWVYSTENTFEYSTSTDGGYSWSQYNSGFAGTSYLTAEQIYVPPFSGGDLNGDFVANILDVVFMVQYVLGNQEFNDEQLAAGDLTQDGGINILDIVALVNQITNTNENYVTDFLYEDMNDNSPTYGQDVGPPIYEGKISAYYFGKAG